ncbi:hypothetical protein HanPI659440_Chr12g0475171 [Helianthus annuus]|nr:hypothetical protein HanPI659440_Chr12g0475171 [Helianthus annuus]
MMIPSAGDHQILTQRWTWGLKIINDSRNIIFYIIIELQVIRDSNDCGR